MSPSDRVLLAGALITGFVLGVLAGRHGAHFDALQSDSAALPKAKAPELHRKGVSAGVGESDGVGVVIGASPCGDSTARQLRFCQDLLGAQLASLVGTPVDWPMDMPVDYSPDSILAALEDAAEHCPDVDVDHISLDCDEFPCLLLQYVPNGQSEIGIFDCEVWTYPFTRSRSAITSDGARIRAVPIAPTRWCRDAECANYDKRWEFRAASALEVAREEWDPLEPNSTVGTGP